MRVKEFRESRDLTQEQVAEKLGISRVAYTNKENGRRQFNVDELLKLEKIFECSITDMFSKK